MQKKAVDQLICISQVSVAFYFFPFVFQVYYHFLTILSNEKLISIYNIEYQEKNRLKGNSHIKIFSIIGSNSEERVY